ncbi:MAG: class I SAM-dependent methyltransferase [Candidatus Gracilibacteria bacterium]|jgi:predicted O-methyltransferase YrrM
MLEDVLKRIETENEAQDQWIVGPATGKMLHWLVRVLEPEVVLEIGTSVGYSALWMASALEKNQRGQLWTIESHEERFHTAQRNIEAAGLEHRILQLRGHAPEIFTENPILPKRIDLAFFDATKQEHQSYFDAIFPRIPSGGMIVVDNVRSHRFGKMQSFIEATHKHAGLKVVEIPVGDGLLIARVV